MSAILKVQPLKNVALSPSGDARNYELLIVAESVNSVAGVIAITISCFVMAVVAYVTDKKR